MTTVLVCDDDDDIRSLLVAILGSVADRVVETVDGGGALRAVEEHRPDLLVTDRGLGGGIDGLEVTRRVRSMPSPRPRVLLLTGRRADEDVEDARAAGVDDFLGKPFRVPELMDRVRALLEIGPHIG